MYLKNFYTLSLLVIGSVLMTNCASLTGFETGKTVGEGNGFFTASLNATRTPDFDLEINDSTDIGSAFFFPNVEIGGRYGIMDRLDIGIKANTNLNIMLDAKYQLLGDENSKAAMSIGLGAGSFGFPSPLWNVQIPAYLSVHPSEKFAFYLNPRYVIQFAVGDLTAGSLRYAGGNTGFLIGEEIKFGIDAGYYSVSAGDDNEGEFDNLITIGLGFQIPF